MQEEVKFGGKVLEVPNAENDAKIKQVATFAVAEYNRELRTNVEFVRVVKASKEEVFGMCYFPTIEVVYRGKKLQCEVEVWEMVFQNFIRLEKFKQCKNDEQSSCGEDSLAAYEVYNPSGTCPFGDMCSAC